MVFKTMMIGVVQHTFGLGSSSFDMGSDVVNALNMLGFLKYSTKDTVSLPKSSSAHVNNNGVTFGMNEPTDGTEEKGYFKHHKFLGCLISTFRCSHDWFSFLIMSCWDWVDCAHHLFGVLDTALLQPQPILSSTHKTINQNKFGNTQ